MQTLISAQSGRGSRAWRTLTKHELSWERIMIFVRGPNEANHGGSHLLLPYDWACDPVRHRNRPKHPFSHSRCQHSPSLPPLRRTPRCSDDPGLLGISAVQSSRPSACATVRLNGNRSSRKNTRMHSRLEKAARKNHNLSVDYEVQANIICEKTARLKALRLTKKGAEKKNSAA